MRVAIGASWSRKEEVKALVAELVAMGVQVACHWCEEPIFPHYERKYLVERGLDDLRDIRDCDYFVRLGDDLSGPFISSGLATGGHHFETGFAFALGKVIVVVGGHQNIFDWFPTIVHVKDNAELKRLLSPVEVM